MPMTYVDLDVRPVLKSSGEPFALIMQTVNGLRPGQGIRLLATFKPVPLFSALGSMGFAHEAREIGGGDWEVLFWPSAESGVPGQGEALDPTTWPAASRELDLCDLDPPEPMVRILAATEEMQHGEVISALLLREPVFLFPELQKRGHAWRGAFLSDGVTYHLAVRVQKGAAA